ncbi:hypothetical protein B7R74_02245 [Yersinia pseudotuberculosis]|nr:hypothetical protein B7R74_02245 [Yersinia pseudotuberculosis]
MKQARPCDVAPAFTKKVGARSATAADYILNRGGDRINQHFFQTESFSAIINNTFAANAENIAFPREGGD